MIHIIGNSHINNFSNSETLSFISNDCRFNLYHIGPVIAYNFLENHMNELYNKLSSINKEKDYVCIVVGEVDCRLHLPLQADKQNKNDEDIVKECVERFFRCYVDLINNGYKVFTISTHPTTTEEHNMSDISRPIYGNMERRNNICLLWNKYLKENSIIRDIKYIDYYIKLVDNNNKTKMEYFIDYCHLNSSKIFSFIIEELKLKHILI